MFYLLNQLIVFLSDILLIAAEQKQHGDVMGRKKEKNDDKSAKDRRKLGKSASGKNSIYRSCRLSELY